MSHEHKVQEFYDSALYCYEHIMGEHWHHGDPEAVTAQLSRTRACEVIEERVASLAGLGPNSRVLDFGSGIGGPTLHMAGVTGATFVGVTNNERLNSVARQEAAKRGISERVSFVTLDDTGYMSLPFEDNSFDAATFFESICHLTDKAALFREIHRVLRPGGRLSGMDWIQRSFGEIQSEEQIMQYMKPVNEWIAIPWHGTVESYKSMMEAAGLKSLIAKDLYEGVKCWGSVQDVEQPDWLSYSGPEQLMFREGEKALAAAREAGVFTIGMWVARKPL